MSWNRYAYVGGDPVNRYDPTGLCGGLPQPHRRFGADVEGDDGDNDCSEGGDGNDCGPGWITDASESGPCFSPPEQNAPSVPSCDTQEIAYVTAYLSKRGSPLADDAGEIVEFSDAYGIDDRFIVALAGIESIYGKTQQTSPTWGYYNAFSNGAHCIALNRNPGPHHSDCYTINPYTSYDQAIFDAVTLLTGPKYFGSGLVTPATINKRYNRTPTTDDLVTIYKQMVPTATADTKVNFSRCP